MSLQVLQLSHFSKALEGGLTIEAAVDFTGGIPELIDMTSTTMSEVEIFHLMKKSYERGAFLGCALGVRNNIKCFILA